MRLGHHRAVIGLRIAGRTDLEVLNARDQLFNQNVGGLLADRHRHRDRHAAFAGRAVAGADQGIDRLIHVGIRHHDHVVLGAAETLHAFPVGAAGRIDVLGDRGGADEADRLHAGIGEQGVDGFLVAVDHVENTGRQTCLHEQFGDPHRHRRIAFRRLEDEGVAAGDRGRAFPQRDHRRKIERRNTGDHAKRLPCGIDVDAGAGAFGELAFQQMRNAAGKFHHLKTALDVAFGVGKGLAVFRRQQLGEIVVFLLDQLQELKHHARATLRIGRAPGRLRRLGIGDGVLDLGMLGKRDLGLHLAGIGIEDVAEPPGNPLDALAADEMADLAHQSLSSGFYKVHNRTPGLWCPFAAIFAAFWRPVSWLAGPWPAVFVSQSVSLYRSLTAPV